MKTQQRKFVVERKSSRRRLTTQPASIWGDTDLKALVRKAEADAPHLFDHSVVSDVSSYDGQPQPQPSSEADHNDDAQTGNEQPMIALAVEAEQDTLSPQSDDLTSDAASQLELDTPSTRPIKAEKRRRARSGNRQAARTSVPPTVIPSSARVEAPVDELIALDDENHRLKGLLAQHLRQQNVQLQTMLARFGVS